MQVWLQHLNEVESTVCRVFSVSRRQWVRHLFAAVSRLGDGIAWYSLMAVLATTQGLIGLQASLHMMLTGAVALALYKSLKGVTRRERPCTFARDIVALVPPLDRYSFPSGHTLHAVAFTTVALHYFPSLAWVLIPFTLLVASSRVVLGLHYPSDVLVATAIGLVLGNASLALIA